MSSIQECTISPGCMAIRSPFIWGRTIREPSYSHHIIFRIQRNNQKPITLLDISKALLRNAKQRFPWYLNVIRFRTFFPFYLFHITSLRVACTEPLVKTETESTHICGFVCVFFILMYILWYCNWFVIISRQITPRLRHSILFLPCTSSLKECLLEQL